MLMAEKTTFELNRLLNMRNIGLCFSGEFYLICVLPRLVIKQMLTINHVDRMVSYIVVFTCLRDQEIIEAGADHGV